MTLCTLGTNGPKVSALGIGAMSFSDFYGPTDQDQSHAILDRAMDTGVTLIDTSNVYGMGKSELAIGSYLAARGQAARDHFVICTKAGISRTDEGKRAFDNSPAHLESELDSSLKRLGVDCVDLFYVHRREAARPIEEVTETLARLVAKGKTRSIGYSEIAPSSLRRAAAVHPIAAVQSEYSLSTRAPELGLVQACADLGTALVAFSPVGRSLLTDMPISAATVAELPFLSGNPRFMAPNYAANIALTAPFRALAADMGVPAAALAIAWVLHQGAHVLPIPGTRSVAHFNELLRGTTLTLTADDIARIETVLPVGWAHGDRYSDDQWNGPERFS
ncbi:aldo/keto reductase [Thalassovita taeanensis]|uniref:Predicted oxidoreductase n=1 Tax=Thalassovita taeanensis TaxID=657014 RepID=A0A1H9HHQ6_9RHOB|nr:aldo/keto reductase [Thalassovita taeanensis]SEQ61881.1 Predicted oxidoreductase [Thalassovita taeanensis]